MPPATGAMRCALRQLDRIPMPIVAGEVDHMVPRPGDHGIVFEPIEEPAKAAPGVERWALVSQDHLCMRHAPGYLQTWRLLSQQSCDRCWSPAFKPPDGVRILPRVRSLATEGASQPASPRFLAASLTMHTSGGGDH